MGKTDNPELFKGEQKDKKNNSGFDYSGSNSSLKELPNPPKLSDKKSPNANQSTVGTQTSPPLIGPNIASKLEKLTQATVLTIANATPLGPIAVGTDEPQTQSLDTDLKNLGSSILDGNKNVFNPVKLNALAKPFRVHPEPLDLILSLIKRNLEFCLLCPKTVLELKQNFLQWHTLLPPKLCLELTDATAQRSVKVTAEKLATLKQKYFLDQNRNSFINHFIKLFNGRAIYY